MLTNADLDFIDESRSEILTHRERNINVSYVEEMRDPLTNLPIGEEEVSRGVTAVVTEISSSGGINADKTIEGGIVYEEGDIKVDISIELISDIARKIERIKYDDEDYEILAVDKKGLGRRNRYEIIGRVIA